MVARILFGDLTSLSLINIKDKEVSFYFLYKVRIDSVF